MAIITLAGGVAQASGSVGGTTFSRNRGGPYMRTRAIPVNPGTPQQSAVRGILAQLTSLWVNTLTGVQRDAWDTYALNVPLPNALGEPGNVGGLGMYVRSNVGRVQSGEPRVDDAPTIFDLGDYTPPAVLGVVSVGAGISIGFDNTDAWANEDDSAMLFYTGREQNASINFFKGPYRFAGRIEGDSIAAPTSPFALTGAFPVAVGNKVFVRAVVTRADGRLSADFRAQGTAI